MAWPGPGGLTLGVCLIVRDEGAQLADCLRSIEGLADEIVVYDTGSMDNSCELARAAGAKVICGPWPGDFAVARNSCLQHARADWILSLDADERVVADGGELRQRLAQGSAPAWMIEIHNVVPAERGGDYLLRFPKLFRRDAITWIGAIHEQPALVGGGEPPTADMPTSALRLIHYGYADEHLQPVKAKRNAEIAERELATLLDGHHDGARMARVLLNTGRTLLGSGRRQEAFDTFDRLRRVAPGSSECLQATDYLVLLLLGDAKAHLAQPLIDQLRIGGAQTAYCDWLSAQALVALGQPGEAWRLLEPLGDLVDTGGRLFSAGRLHELRDLVTALLTEFERSPT